MTRPGRVVEPVSATRALHDGRFRVHRRMRDDQRAYRALEAGAALPGR